MRVLIVLFFLFCASSLWAAEDYYHFNSPQQKQQFVQLTTELRCLVCQNQNLAESNAALASDLRGQIYHQLQQGKSSQEIIDYLVARYSNFILYSPPLNKQTIGLWFGPIVLLFGGIFYLIFYLYKNRREQKA